MASNEQIIQAVQASLKRLVTDDEYLLTVDVNERSLSHRFAIYLQEQVTLWKEGWNVDCEYNRDIEGGEDYSKKLDFSADDLRHFHPSEEDEHASTVFPDVIVHRRGKAGSSGGNLIVIEMKKTSSRDDGSFDRTRKLPGYLSQLDYRYAAFVMLKTGGQPGYKLEWVRLPNNDH
jgi:hypothetical protein